MQSTVREEYLVNQVMTATPQKLQLLLIEGAIRFAERGRQHLRDANFEQACEDLIRAQDIVTQILGGLNREIGGELVKKVAELYVFVFRSLMEANALRDERKVDDALGVLQEERETWRQLCEQMPLPPEGCQSPDVATFQPSSGPAVMPDLSADLPAEEYSGGFSLDA